MMSFEWVLNAHTCGGKPNAILCDLYGISFFLCSMELDDSCAYFAPTLRWHFTLTLNLIDQAWQSGKVALALINFCHKTLVIEIGGDGGGTTKAADKWGNVLALFSAATFSSVQLYFRNPTVGRWMVNRFAGLPWFALAWP